MNENLRSRRLLQDGDENRERRVGSSLPSAFFLLTSRLAA
jgi:hypothetical protein